MCPHADNAIGPVGDGGGPFGVFAQRQARNAERGRFFLEAARIRQHDAGVRREAQEVDVTERLRHDDPVRHGDAEYAQSLAGPRMNREHDRQLRTNHAQGLNDRPKCFGMIDVRWAMQRQDRILPLVHVNAATQAIE